MSASTPGNIDCALYLEVKERAANIWDDSGSITADYIATVDTAQAILTRQTARMRILEQPDKDRELKVWWPDYCSTDEPTDCDDQCDFTGPTAGTQCKDYALNECFQVKWSWTEEQFRTSEMEPAEFEAVMLLRAMKRMDEFVNKKAQQLLDAQAGVNKYADQYEVVDGDTYIPASGWTPDLAAYLFMVARKNRIQLPNMANGDNLAQLAFLVSLQTTDPFGQSAQAKLAKLGNMSWDISLDDNVGAGSKVSYLWNSNAVVIANKARNLAYPSGRWIDNPRVFWGTMASRNLPKITYDFFMKDTCVSNSDVRHDRMLSFRGGFFGNPVGCDNDLTGVLKFICGEAPQ